MRVVQLKVPEAFPAAATKVAPSMAGIALRSAVSEPIASPSGSEAVTCTWVFVPPTPLAAAGALTTRGRSVFVTGVAAGAGGLRAVDAGEGTEERAPPWGEAGG